MNKIRRIERNNQLLALSTPVDELLENLTNGSLGSIRATHINTINSNLTSGYEDFRVFQ